MAKLMKLAGAALMVAMAFVSLVLPAYATGAALPSPFHDYLNGALGRTAVRLYPEMP